MLYYIYYIYFIIFLIEVLNANVVYNENDIITNLTEINSDVITLNINSEINITKKIKINNSIKQLFINGKSLYSAKLNLKYPLYFDSNIEEIEIKNININGKLFFNKNNNRIIFDKVNLNGYIDSNFDKNSNNNIEITEFNYKPSGESTEYCINLSGNIKINKSNFYGNSSCQNRLLHFNGFGKYKFNLNESNFNGEYECPFLYIEKALNVFIKSSNFEKSYSSKYINGGGYIKNN